MNEVIKLYENAGIKKFEPKEEFSLDDCEEYCVDNNCKKCSWRKYPPFTAEKQIKIIEWLGNSKAFFDVNGTIFSLITNHKDKNGVVRGYEGKGNSVDSCLASLINNLWQDLTDVEKAEIKNILESEVRE